MADFLDGINQKIPYLNMADNLVSPEPVNRLYVPPNNTTPIDKVAVATNSTMPVQPIPTQPIANTLPELNQYGETKEMEGYRNNYRALNKKKDITKTNNALIVPREDLNGMTMLEYAKKVSEATGVDTGMILSHMQEESTMGMDPNTRMDDSDKRAVGLAQLQKTTSDSTSKLINNWIPAEKEQEYLVQRDKSGNLIRSKTANAILLIAAERNRLGSLIDKWSPGLDPARREQLISLGYRGGEGTMRKAVRGQQIPKNYQYYMNALDTMKPYYNGFYNLQQTQGK